MKLDDEVLKKIKMLAPNEPKNGVCGNSCVAPEGLGEVLSKKQ